MGRNAGRLDATNISLTHRMSRYIIRHHYQTITVHCRTEPLEISGINFATNGRFSTYLYLSGQMGRYRAELRVFLLFAHNSRHYRKYLVPCYTWYKNEAWYKDLLNSNDQVRMCRRIYKKKFNYKVIKMFNIRLL